MDSDHGSSAKWDAADRVLFSWLDLPVEQIDERLGAMAHRDPAMAAALHSRLAQLRRLGMVAPATVSEPTAGRTFGGYEIVRLLGVGGMGSVYLAEQRSPRRQVALKVIRPDRLGDRAARERFQREARAVAALRDPGICAVIEVGEAEGTPFLAMQYIEGETLAERLAAQRALGSDASSGSSGPRTPADIHGVLRLVEKVARSLHVAHEAGVVHRDIKPGNLMIDRNGEPVLLDFGLAHVHGAAGEAALTRTGDVLGTPAYMSPEQVRPVGQPIDRRTDVYSLAATLFECLTLARPFASANEAELYERILRDPTPDPRRHNPHVPVDVGAVIAKAMEKDPARRYASVAEFADDLARLQRREPPRAQRIGWLGRSRRWAQRNPRAAGLISMLALSLAGVSVLLSVTMGQREQIRTVAQQAQADATRAEAAQARESARAAELEVVAEFQAAQLRGIDPEAMGAGMRRNLLAQVREAQQRTVATPEQADARISELEDRLVGANFTNLALISLRDTIFDKSLRAIADSFGDQPLVRARLLQAMGEILQELGLYDLAMAPQQEALQLRTELLGPDSSWTLAALHGLASLQMARGNFTEALPLLQDAVRRAPGALGPKHRDCIGMMLDLGGLFLELGRLDEAESMLHGAEQVAQTALPASDILRTSLALDIAELQERRGDRAGAERSVRDALDRCMQTHGTDDLLTRARNSLATLVSKRGGFAEAESLLHANLQGQLRHRGNKHPDALRSLHNLALLQCEAGHYPEAERCFRDVLREAEAAFGPNDFRVASVLSGLATALLFQGRNDEAEDCLRRVVKIERLIYGDDAAETMFAVGNLASALMQAGKHEEAETHCRQALTWFLTNKGKEHPMTLDAMLRRRPATPESPPGRGGTSAPGCRRRHAGSAD